MASNPELWQVALSAIDLELTEAWFRKGLGFLPSGGSRAMMSMKFAGRVQGLEGARSTCWWMVADNPRFQLEIFQFSHPPMRLLPDDWRVSDTGYSRMGIHVADFDGTLARLAQLGTFPVRPVAGENGARRAAVRSPDGVFVELMEADPLPDAPRQLRGSGVAVRTVGLTTLDLEASIGYFRAITGREAIRDEGESGSDHAIFGLDGARCRCARIPCGDVVLELCQYDVPSSRPWRANHRISDQGILNLGFGMRSRKAHDEVYQRLRAFGAVPNREPLHMGVLGLVYVNDPLGFSAEILWTRPGLDQGYEPAPAAKRPRAGNRKSSAEVWIDASPAEVWAALSGFPASANWIGGEPGSSIRPEGAPRHGRGARYQIASESGGLVQEVTHWLPERMIGYRIIEGGAVEYHNGLVRLVPEKGGTRLVSEVCYRAENPLAGWKVRQNVRKSLAVFAPDALKTFIESRRAR